MIIKYVFCPPKRYLRDKPINDDVTNQVDNGGDEEDVDSTLTGDITPGFVEEIQSLDSEEYNYHNSIDSSYEDRYHYLYAIDIGMFFDKGNGSRL